MAHKNIPIFIIKLLIIKYVLHLDYQDNVIITIR